MPTIPGFAQRQAFYDAVKAGDDKKAVEIGKAYLAAHPNEDTFALDVAYAELRAGERADAVALFEKLEDSTNAHVASTARGNNSRCSREPPIQLGYAYNAVQYESRFNDVILDGFNYYNLRTGRSTSISYASLHYTYDTQSNPAVGQIYYQNYVAPAIRSARNGSTPYSYVVCRSRLYAIGLGGQRTRQRNSIRCCRIARLRVTQWR